ncbi:ubiquitin carboxyl-terminal hydrolase 25 [Geosmithia morbida]|uniref:ubiquitinyl hydrolase 1 n=1 Tax=Geosmithia morbida TaxID=1094350 RepID=A0A9P4Z297_9HYPO|nr:ubiquitin carboxyl-terminal hydrolase 25 [Geosmithia morbida]KAF4126097.1 ubiquitin carboxyl-terminal hydrolase 25 [Geosmithia morbida]
MALAYHAGPGPGQDGTNNPYAVLPGTKPGTFIQHNMVPMKSRALSRDQPGCHPSRWIHELVNNNFTICDMFGRAKQADLDTPFEWQHEHRLVLNGNQSRATHDRKVLSSICLDCHFHFIFKLSWDPEHAHEQCNASQATWPMRDDSYPWHHLAWAGSEADHVIADEWSKYYPLRAREHFACVAPPCTFQITLDVSEPRMGSEWIRLLQDEDTILRELRRATEKDPQRYEGATDDWAKQAPLNLNTYLKNLLESDAQSARAISKRNKRFAVVFGPRCFGLFRALGFEEAVDMQDGVDEGTFTPMPPPPSTDENGITQIGTYRAYIEDVRNEVQSLIHKMGQVGENPSFVSSALHTDLGCKEVPNISGNALVNIERYRLLGILPNQPREIVVNAYFRQWDLLPGKRREMVDALMAVANDGNDEQLSDFAMMQSSVFDSQLPVQGTTDEDGLLNQALLYLGLNPPNTYSAEKVIDAFRGKLVESPADASTARAMLIMIAQNTTDDNYQTSLIMEADVKMSTETSKAILGGDGPGRSRDDWYNSAVLKLQAAKNRDESVLYVQALESLAENTQDYELKAAAFELRSQHEAREPSADDSAPKGEDASDLSLPVGLHNIGNTCYLNSLLQYLYTVKAVRDIATNYGEYNLDLSDDSIAERRLGGNRMQLDRGEAVVAQAFVKELGELFHNLHTSSKVATRPSQRLANAALLSTHALLEDARPASTAAVSRPPSLPERQPDVPTTPASEQPSDVEMSQVSASKSEDQEAHSRASSATLVGAGDEQIKGLDGKTQEAAPRKTAGGSLIPDIVMEDVDGAKAEDPDPDTVDAKVLRALEHQKRSSGTEQQDVEEVMGKIISLLQAAIKPTDVDADTGIQSEKIMETFFVTTVNYTKKFGEKTYQREVSYDRSITAFPAPGQECSLYEALGRNFDQQVLEDSQLSRYTAIRSLPPVLHVLIQRTLSTGRKNANPVVIPETLYLDHYMDAPHDSAEFQRRKEDWTVTTRLADIRQSQLDGKAFSGSGRLVEKMSRAMRGVAAGESKGNSWAGIDGDAMAVDPQQDATPEEEEEEEEEEDWSFDGTIEDDFILVSPRGRTEAEDGGASSQPLQGPEDVVQAEETVQRMIDEEISELESARREHFSSSQKHAYRLEAVICHSGNLQAGHYWVWIRDFANDIWRCYNDATVRVETDTAKVLHDLSKGGEPYYLCYVRDEDKEEWVDVPTRDVPVPVPALAADSSDADADADMTSNDADGPAPPAEAETVSSGDVPGAAN